MSPENLERRVAELEEALDVMVSTVEHLVGAAGRPGGKNRPGEPPAWLHGRPAGDSLAEWVTWFNESGYLPAQPNHRIPACWAQHPGMAAELLTLWHTWQHAFCDPEAEPEAAQNWHDRWLPGVLSRIGVWTPSRCLNGGHPTT